MFDYCDYWDGDHSDGHDQNGYHAEVYRKKKGLHVGHDKSLVKSLSINLPGGAYGNIDVDPDANCGDVSVNENGIFYDVFVSGEINAAAMKLCREWCTNISYGNDTLAGTQHCGKRVHDEL
ncbi:hypothetical protein EV179_004489 [Coemansia sp. RSA 487]|nr:hypothetical protein EV179_004489 [Coemansia sp. RSA 487]